MTALAERIRRRASAALQLLDSLPHEDNPETRKRLAEVIDELVRMRDELIAAGRAGEACEELLGRTNAALSSIFGTEFPVHGLQWKRVCETREAIRRWLDAAAIHAEP